MYVGCGRGRSAVGVAEALRTPAKRCGDGRNTAGTAEAGTGAAMPAASSGKAGSCRISRPARRGDGDRPAQAEERTARLAAWPDSRRSGSSFG